MTPLQKAVALNALAPIELRINAFGRWSCGQPGVEIADGHTLAGAGGFGDAPEKAIEERWAAMVDDLPEKKWIVVDAMKPTRRAFRWNGFMWAPFEEPKPK